MTQKTHDESQIEDSRRNSFPDGFFYLRGYLDADMQQAIMTDISTILKQAPLFEQRMPKTGAPLSVRMSNAGLFGWVTDRDGGYRYQKSHPITGKPWPAISQRLLDLWLDVTGDDVPPNLCLINYYDAQARLGMHQDKGDGSLAAPVLSISLGDDAVFLVGGLARKDPAQRITLRSGDVVKFGGSSRLIYHGVERVEASTSSLLKSAGMPDGGRINLTLRRLDRH